MIFIRSWQAFFPTLDLQTFQSEIKTEPFFAPQFVSANQETNLSAWPARCMVSETYIAPKKDL